MIQEELLLEEELDSESEELLFFDELALFLLEERCLLSLCYFSLARLCLYLDLSRPLPLSRRLSRSCLPLCSGLLRLLSFSFIYYFSFFSICLLFFCLFSLGLRSRFSSSTFSIWTVI